ncbi:MULTISPECIES: hypothetical protein [Alphaproteobacteria]|uniref:hypothetical protein n=1 Tax=Alphaproteobacteria TaxID=28211 RepID=UPI00329A3729
MGRPLFSQRYFKALAEGKLTVELDDRVRAKLWKWMEHFNCSVYVQPDPHDNWTNSSWALAEVAEELAREHGEENAGVFEARSLVKGGNAAVIFDAIELEWGWVGENQRSEFRDKLNLVFELHECPWRFSEGEFFKLDADFVGARLTTTAYQGLANNRFAGAADEYAKAKQELATGDIKDAILHAGKSYESVLKVLTGLEHVNADRLAKAFLEQGYLDDIPESVRSGFVAQVLATLPFLRNKLAGHGQGAEVTTVAPAYGELAIQVAAAFHNFLIAKHLEKMPPAVDAVLEVVDVDEELPF